MLKKGVVLQKRYEIRGIVADEGTFSIVYRAYDQWLRSEVAIKEFSPLAYGDLSEKELLQRFKAEARITRRLEHPYIIEIYDLFWANETLYLVMPYLPDTLKRRLGDGPLPYEEAVRVITQICEGMAYAHTAFVGEGSGGAVVHCDLKPANILFDHLGDVKITDFGVAHIPPIPGLGGVRMASMYGVGTLAYMAPEQFEHRCDDPRVDVYALGALSFHILSGELYLNFEMEFTTEAQRRNRQMICESPPRLHVLRARGVPADVVAVVAKALAKEPQERYAHAGEMLEALRGAIARTEARAVPAVRAGEKGEGAVAPVLPPPQAMVLPGGEGTASVQEIVFPVETVLPAKGERGMGRVGASWLRRNFVYVLLSAVAVTFSLVSVALFKFAPLPALPPATRTVSSERSTRVFFTLPPATVFTRVPLITPSATATRLSSAEATATGRPVLVVPPCTDRAPPPGWGPYAVQRGDTLSTLAALRGTTVRAIMEVNCLESAVILVGWRLYLPLLPTATAVVLPSPTLTLTVTVTATPTAMATPTLRPTVTLTPTPAATVTPTVTATLTPTAVPTLTVTPTPLPTLPLPTLTPTLVITTAPTVVP